MAKINKKVAILSVILIATSFSVINVAVGYNAQSAAEQLCSDPKSCPIKTPDDIFNILANVLKYTYTIFFIIAVIFILIAAFSFLTAKGDPTAIVGARSQIVWAVVAIIIALLSVGAAQIINSFLSS